jgi:hypothetical protein
MSNRPAATEHSESVKGYVALVPEEDVTAALEKQGRESVALFHMLTDDKAAFRYAPGKWSVKQLIGHVADAERVFTYRALAIARGESKPLPAFDENAYAAAAEFDRRTLRDLVDEYEAVRHATVALFRGLPAHVWTRLGTANEKPVSVRALAYIALGHERHHLRILRERYGV